MNVRNRLKNLGAKAGVGATALAGSALALADDSIETAISGAVAQGTSYLQLAVSGVIGIVAVVVGVGIIIKFLQKA